MPDTADTIRKEAQAEARAELGAAVVSDAQKMLCQQCDVIIEKAEFIEHEKLGHVLIDSPALRKTYEKDPVMHDAKSGAEIILAKNAEIGKPYLTSGMHYQVEVVKKLGDETHTSSVVVKSETSPYKTISIAPNTELIPYREDLHVTITTTTSPEGESTMSTDKKLKARTPKAEKPPKVKAEPKTKMSDIVNPMLLANKHTAEEIADAVIKAIPEKKGDRDKLILQIKGPRLYNLKNDKEACGGKTPGLKQSAEDKAKVAAREKAKAEAAKKPKPEKKPKAEKKPKTEKPSEVAPEAAAEVTPEG
jgi:hypothetical protein